MKLLTLFIFTTFFTFANAQFIEHSDNIIKDTKTNFLWQDSENVKTQKMNFSEAVNYCKNLEVDNEKGWILPDFMALFSLVNTKVYNPTLSKKFKYFISDNYWTTKTCGHAKSGEAFVINFLSGAFNRELMEDKFYVRCYKK
jgi:hypothetical protein